jgi:hypothetical protein
MRPLAGALVLATGASIALAADHNEATGTKADSIADIDDIYAWSDGAGKDIVVLTFAGPGADPVVPPDTYDADVLYTVSIDNDGDAVSDIDVLIRFGQDSSGNWGVQFENVPGSTGPVSGAVQTELTLGTGLSGEAGVFDDPFFFDFTGLTDTLATATVSFDSTRDAFSGKNVNAIIFQMDEVTALGGGTTMSIWATTGRK